MTRCTSATTAADIHDVRVLFREYAESLGVDLSYQGFDEELRDLPGAYGAPRGTLVIARDGDVAVGCVGVRPLGDDIAEMKRLYVRPAGRGRGLGRELADEAIRFARASGYRCMRLDTLPQMLAAQSMYDALGFRRIEPYRYSAVPGTVFMELDLVPASPGLPRERSEPA